MSGKKETRIANPTIEEVLGKFLEDQARRLAARTFKNYQYVVELLEDSLNGYAYQSLDKKDAALFNRLFNLDGEEHREFCQIFGPEHILPNVGEFLGYFMVRKVIAGKEILRAAGTVTKKLARWLAENGYVDTEDAAEGVERGGRAARDLPAAEALASLLHDLADGQARGDREGEIEDSFTILQVERGKLWIEGMLHGSKLGPVPVPERISRRCRVGWSISGVVGRAGKQWRFVEAWNVYPA